MAGWGVFGGVVEVLFWVLLVVIVIKIIRGSLYGGRHGNCGGCGMDNRTNGNVGLEILNKRYASGEISKEEYEQKKKDILG